MSVETKPSGLTYFNPYSEEHMKLYLPEGDHVFRAGFIDDPFVKTLGDKELYSDKVNKFFGAMYFVGPYPSKVEKESRKKILICDPKTGVACTQKIISTLARRAYRRPVTATEVASLMHFTKTCESSGTDTGTGDSACNSGDAGVAPLPVPYRARRESDERERGPQDFGCGTGGSPELLPVEFDAG